MFKHILLFFTFISLSFSQNCYTPKDLSNKGLVSYQNKVYDIKNYVHPGGQDFLLLSVGKPLEEYFNMNKYSFHIASNQVAKDLQQLYIGNLQNNCLENNNNKTNNNITITKNVFNDSNIFYSTITFSLFFLFLLTILSLNFFNCYYLNKIVYLYCLGYYSRDIILFYVIYLFWWTSLLVLSFVYNKNEDILTKLGIWISLNIAFSLLPITKNSLWIYLFRIPYTKLMNIHKLISVLCLISVFVKVITIIVLYKFTYLYRNISSIFGTVCSLSIFLTCILSMPIIRKKFYELFYYSHRFLYLITIISMSFHYIICLYYVMPSLILYIIDIIIRLFNTRKAIYSKIKVYDSYIFIYLSFVKPIKINPGCYFFVCSNKISNLEWHPLSLILEKNDNMLFCVKNMGENSWSNNLKKLENNEYLFNKNDNIYLQGPYYHINLNYDYEYIINIANGIGITPFFSILKKINNIITENDKTIIKKVVFIWIIPDMSFVLPFMDCFKYLDNIDIQIFFTKEDDDYEDESLNFAKFFYEKPIIFDYVKNFIETNEINDNKKVSIISCGSESLLKDIYYTCSYYGIELYNESFI